MMHMMSFDNNLMKRGASSFQKRKGSGILTRLKDSFSHGSPFKSAAPESSHDIVSPQATLAVCTPAIDTLCDVRVTIAIQKRVNFGERVAIVGETDALGRWRPCDGVPLTWSEGDVWSAEVSLQPGLHEFKCITVSPDGHAVWELGSNRVIEIPADAGALQARCQWANTAHTTLVAAPAVPDAFTVEASGLQQPLLLQSVPARMDSVSDSSLWSAQSTDAAVDLSGALSALEEKAQTAAAAPAGCLDDDTCSTSSSAAVCVTGVGMGKHSAVPQEDGSEDGQLIPRGSCAALGIQESSGDLSSYAYEYSNSSSSISDAVSPEPAYAQQQQLTSAALAAAAAAAGGASNTTYTAATDGVDDSSELDNQQLSATPSTAPFLRLDIPAAPAAPNLFSPISTTSTRPLRGAVSLSTMSYSSMEVSEPLPEEGSGTISSEENLAAAAYMLDAVPALGEPGAAPAVDSLGDTVTGDDCSLADILADPLAFEQLMAVEPAQLAPQQQQKLVTPQSAKAAVAHDRMDSVFATAAAAAVAAADRGDIMDAAAAVCELGAELDPSKLLPNEDTLPPAGLLKFEQVSLTSEITPQTTTEITAITEEFESEEEQALLSASADSSMSAGVADLRDSSTSSARSSFSSNSSLTKDQLPDLGLTVTVPTAADKAAAKAAEMNAAKSVAAAAAAAAKRSSGRGAADDLLEPPVAQEGLRLLSSAHMIPHVDKVSTGGEDAYFISPAGHGAIGVSDGVSAWAEDGIDPGEYSRTLVQYCAEAFEERVMAATRAANKGKFIEKFDPRSILRYAQQCTCKPGSATVVLAAMQPGGKLHVANLGDCGVKVVRDGKVVYETQPQQHDFNLPYQLSHPRLFPDTDTADSADRYAWDVKEGDVIVAASDGLFDNLWDDELLQLLQQGLLGITPLDSANSLSSMDSLGRSAGKKLLRSRSFAALSRSSSGAGLQPSGSSPAAVPLPAGAAASTGGGVTSSSGLSRSRSTSNLASWGAKQLRQWKGKGGKPPHATAMNAAQYSVAEGCEDCSDSDIANIVDQAVVVPLPPPKPKTTVDCSPADVSRAAELLAAAAAAHAADKEFKSPWSVAAGKAYGLLARLFAKGGKMDDITCVVAVVQEAGRLSPAESVDSGSWGSMA